MTKEQLLDDLLAGKLDRAEYSRQLELLDKSLYCKVSEKGAISVYGLQRMPVTLYVEQWERLNLFMPEVVSFAKAHPELSRKPPKTATAATTTANPEASRLAKQNGQAEQPSNVPPITTVSAPAPKRKRTKKADAAPVVPEMLMGVTVQKAA